MSAEEVIHQSLCPKGSGMEADLCASAPVKVHNAHPRWGGRYVSITVGSKSPHGDACLHWKSAEWSLAILKARGHSMLLHTSGVCDFLHFVTRDVHLAG